MKLIGLLGGISWVSTADYYRLINQGINDELGELNFSECLIYSFNYEEIKKSTDINDWGKIFDMLFDAAQKLKNSGVKALVLCANTMHYVADQLEKEIGLPIINIATETAKEIKKNELKKIGLLGTKFTMELDFFKSKLTEKDIETIIPNDKDREFIHQSIYAELGKGIINHNTKEKYLEIIDRLISNGAEGIILGCTEIPLIINQSDVKVPIFDTALIHSKAIVEFQLNKEF
ncbi:aspartate/glutamate racemase family protein [Halpernia sp. GG3]